MNQIKEYDFLVQKQGQPFKTLKAEEILSAVASAGRAGDLENSTLTIRDDQNRSEPILEIGYEFDEEKEKEYINVHGANQINDSFPLMNEAQTAFHSQALEKRLHQLNRTYGTTDIYMDSPYLYARELEIQTNEPIEPSPDQNPQASDSNPFSVLLMNHKRTKLEETELPVDLKTMAQRLEAKGYLIRIKPGGSLLVQDQNLAPQNSITITKKNAYIEDVSLQSPSAIRLYQEMKDAVLNTVETHFAERKEQLKAISDFPGLADCSLLTIANDLITEHMQNLDENRLNLSDIFLNSKMKYQFLDDKGNDFLALSLQYKATQDKTMHPVLSLTYGEAYGNFEKTFQIGKEECEAVKQNTFYRTNLAKEIKDFSSIGIKERTSNLALLKAAQVKRVLDKEISKEFKYLNAAKIEYFSNIALDYYLKKPEGSLSSYELEKLKEAPFYRSGMTDESIVTMLRKTFDGIDQKIEDPKLSSMTKREMKLEEFSCNVYKNDQLVMDTNKKEPISYDREWINRLAKLEDSLLELRYGPIKDLLSIAAIAGKGTKEVLSGIASFQLDGIYSGFDIGKGIGFFREGWNYGGYLSELEKECKTLSASDLEEEKIAAIDKKMDLKLLRDDIKEQSTIYVKAAILLKETCDQIIDQVRRIKQAKKDHILSDLQSMKHRLISYSKEFVTGYHQLKTALSKMNQDIKDFLDQKKTIGNDLFHYTAAKSQAILNTTKEAFNEISEKLQILMDVKSFTEERLAEQLNDIKVMKAFGSLPFEEYSKEAKARFWEELDPSIQAGEAVLKIPVKERSSEDLQAIRLGEKLAYQKEQNLFVAKTLRQELKSCYREKLPYLDVVNRLAKIYNNESMTYRLRNSESSIKNYNELSKADQVLCQDIMKEFLHTLPVLEQSFMEQSAKTNSKTLQTCVER